MSAWALVYSGFDPQEEGLRESLCTLGNGYFATRGAAPEAAADDIHYPGTYIAGCYNRLTDEIDGHVIENESLVNAPNWLVLTIRPEGGRWLDLRELDVLAYVLELDLRRGVLTRRLRVRDGEGRRTRLTQRRIVHMGNPHLAALETTVVPENWAGRLEIRSALDGRVENSGVPRYRMLASRHLAPVTEMAGEDDLFLEVVTSQSGIHIAQAARTALWANDDRLQAERRTSAEPSYVAEELALDVRAGEHVTIEKVVTLVTSRDWAISQVGLEARKILERVGRFDELLGRHVLAWDHLWRRGALTLEQGERAALIVNVHVFHLLQTVSPNTVDVDAGVPARGLHGEAYRGHVFWDDLFVFPFLNLRLPWLARELLLYRYRRLPEARWAAQQAGYDGAMFPWQSGSDGREESQVVHLNPRSGNWLPDHSHLQQHLNAAVAYNVWQYYQVTGDLDFLAGYGAEMILELARFFSSRATYNRALDRYELLGVMGPDEYHDGYPDREEPGVDNNAYTNVMAAWVLLRAMDVLELLPEDRRDELRERLGITAEELERFDEISRKLRICFHDGVISQFQGYDGLEELDWKRYREEHGSFLRLDRILEAEGDTPNRYKASKQPDALMLLFLLSPTELQGVFARLGYPLDSESINRTIDYYLERTAHGSTLSGVVLSWILARRDRTLSWEFFEQALESDVSDIQGGTTQEGIHLGAMAGTIDLLQRCYTGLEAREDVLWLDPRLPEEIQRLEFPLRYREHVLTIELTSQSLRVSARPSPAPPIGLGFRGIVGQLAGGESREFPL